MSRLLLIAFWAVGATVALSAQNITFTKIPQSWQLFQRDLSTNQAEVAVAGKCLQSSGYSSLELRLSDESGAVLKTVIKPLAFSADEAAFDFSVKITAGRNNHVVEIWGQKAAGGPYFFEKRVEKLLAGDIFIIAGQSNAIALASPELDDINEYTRSWTGQYGWGKLNLSFPGRWGARLARRIADDIGIPVAIFNGANGAHKIEQLLPKPSDPTANYSQLLTRMEQAGTGKKARAAFFFQGEADGWETSIADYKTRFLTLKNAWKADYCIERAWLFQMRYKSCTAEKPLVLEAQRQAAAEDADTEIMSTTNADHDSCHFYYQNGYRTLADRLFASVANRFYGKNFADAEPPDVSKAYFDSPNSIVVEVSNTANLSVIGWPWGDWRTEGASVGISGGSVSGNKIRLTLAGPATGVTGISYLGHPGNSPHWLVNPAGVGMLAFYNKEVTAAPSQPDFSLASVSVAASVQAGGSATISFYLKNSGSNGSSGSVVVAAWLSSDNVLSINDLSLVTAAISMPYGGSATAGQMLLTIPATAATGNYFIILKCDPAAQIAESNEGNNEQATAISITTIAPPPPPSGAADLELTASTTVPKPAAWATSPALFTLKNTGGATASGIVVGFNIDGKAVYEGGNEATLSKGTFNYISGLWTVGNLDAGQSATITVRLFTLDTLPKRIFGQVTAAVGLDTDSQPGNGSHLAGPAQDDEAWVKLNDDGSTGGITPVQPTADYCKSISDFPWEDWIAGAEIGALSKVSGKSPYSDFTAVPVSLQKGVALPVVLTAGFSYFTHAENWRVWLDFNANKVFEPGEKLFDGDLAAPPNGTPSQSLSGSLTIPLTAADGPARLRVAMSRSAAGPCDTLDFGEYEDYLINIGPNLSGGDPRAVGGGEKGAVWFSVSPNPAGDFAMISMEKLLEKEVALRVTDVFGKVVFEKSTTRAAQAFELLDCRNWQNGLYFVQLETPGFRAATRRLVVARTF